MSNVSHVSTVDRGLKMKIKRTKVGPNSAKNDAKHELPAKGDPAGGEYLNDPARLHRGSTFSQWITFGEYRRRYYGYQTFWECRQCPGQSGRGEWWWW